MKTGLVAAAVAAAFATAAPAQEADARSGYRIVVPAQEILADAASARAGADAWRQWGDDFRASFGTMFGDSFTPAKTVKGAPYSADVSTETTQTLADGNVIAKQTTGRVFRDGEGRTRQETVVGGVAKSIQLRDPVEGSAVMLLPGSRKAVRLPHVAGHKDAKELKVLRLGDREIRIEDGKVTVDGKEARGRVEVLAGGKEIRVENGKVTIDGKELVPSEGGRKVIVKHLEEGDTGDGARREEVRVHVVRSGDGKEVQAFMPAMPPMSPSGRPDGTLAKTKGAATSLGVKDFDGVKAEGTSTVRTIAAGEIGNRNPILVTSETWYSPELQVTVYSRQSDPRHGETTYRLTNIRRGEPAADLFKVPEDYSGSARRGRG